MAWQKSLLVVLTFRCQRAVVLIKANLILNSDIMISRGVAPLILQDGDEDHQRCVSAISYRAWSYVRILKSRAPWLKGITAVVLLCLLPFQNSHMLHVKAALIENLKPNVTRWRQHISLWLRWFSIWDGLNELVHIDTNLLRWPTCPKQEGTKSKLKHN